MYHIHTTDAYVVRRTPHGESNALVTLFTRDFGRVYAVATGVRKGVSKLNPFLQEYSHVRVSLVRGREWWRIVSVSGIRSLYLETRFSADRQRIMVRITKLLDRLLQGEATHEALFDAVEEVFSVLTKRDSTKEELQAIEVIGVLRILHHLGYVSVGDTAVALIEHTITDATIEHARGLRQDLIASINESLTATHL